MKFLSRLLLLLPFIITINSCAFHSGVMTGSAALSNANFKVVDYAIGTAQTTHVLGIGGVGTIVGLGRRAAVIEYNVNDVPKLFVVDYKRIEIKE